MNKNLDHELINGFKEFQSLLNWMTNLLNKEIALDNGEKELLLWSLKNPALEIQEKNKAIQLVYQTKKQEVMTLNIFEQFNLLSNSIWNNTRAIIKSNQELAESNWKYQKALNCLTWWLVLVWIIQIIVTLSKNI